MADKSKKENGTKNNMTALHELLFQQVENLSKSDLTGDQLKEEIERSNAITLVSKQLINNANLVLKARLKIGDQIAITELPEQLK